jgi:LPXTG-site transpeptidase (sortase) family protein
MKTRHKASFYIVAVVTVAAIAVFGFAFVHAVIYAPDGDVIPAPAVYTSPAAVPGVPRELPSRLQIPALSVDAHVQSVGVNGKGDMSAPSNFTDVAWYKYGTAPGQMGSAVMAGHVDNGLSLAGVFKHLSDLQPGDDIYVVTASSTRLHFTVSSVDTFDYRSAPSEEIFGQNDKPYLKLLTCTGKWVQGDRTYDHRLVVTAVLEGQ